MILDPRSARTESHPVQFTLTCDTTQNVKIRSEDRDGEGVGCLGRCWTLSGSKLGESIDCLFQFRVRGFRSNNATCVTSTSFWVKFNCLYICGSGAAVGFPSPSPWVPFSIHCPREKENELTCAFNARIFRRRMPLHFQVPSRHGPSWSTRRQ